VGAQYIAVSIGDARCSSRAKAREEIQGRDPGVTLAALAHPGLNSVAASRLIASQELEESVMSHNTQKHSHFHDWVFQFVITVAVLLLALGLGSAQVSSDSARVWEASLVLPTYELGPPNPYPALLDWQRRKWRPVYPYPFLDSLTNKRTEKTYKAVYLENEYLRVTVLPELGGHLYKIFDKTTNRDVLYSNPVMKYAMVALRGAWVSGGIEWNFPDGHTLTTVSPVDYTTRMEADGSAAVAVGDTERVQGMQWQVIIRLRPGRRDVETEVTLNNRRLVPGRYWYWSTAGAPATADMRFIYPMREAYPHAFWPVFSFPKEKGIDVSKFSEVPNFLSLFARDSKRDFFGVYYEKSDWGIVHVADHREMVGKKTWTWGTDENGNIWIDKLTDGGGQYVEFQGGRFETQLEHEFIAPHRVEHFIEHWFPVNRLGGGWDEATRDMAVRVTYKDNRAVITANANARFQAAEFVVDLCPTGSSAASRIDPKCKHSERVDLDPAEPFTRLVSLPVQKSQPPLLTVTFTSKDGRELLRYRTDTLPDGNPDFKPATRPIPDPKVPTSAEQAYVEGLSLDKKSKEREARASYEEALRRDPRFAPAQIALGLSYYRSGEYEKAAAHLTQALMRNKDAGDAHYYLALVRRSQEQTGEAVDHLIWAVRSGYRESVARYVLGEIALAEDRPAEAAEHLSSAVGLDPHDLKARTVLALAERLTGNLVAAKAHIDSVVQEMPIDYLARHEQYEINKALGHDAEAKAASVELWRLLAREPDSVLELVFDYAAVGRRGEAREILEEAIKKSEQGTMATSEQARATGIYSTGVQPIFHYTLGYLYELNGDRVGAREQYALGAKGDPELVFPHRVEEIAVLRSAVAANPKDGRAAYYLGNVLASKDRDQEALAAWNDAVRLDRTNTIARRNLARALWVSGKKDEAANQYQQAIAGAPDDTQLYVEIGNLLDEMGLQERRTKLLESAPSSVRSHSPFIQALAAAYVDTRRFADAAVLLANNTFTSGEGEDAALALYRRAHLGLARKYQESGEHLKAAAEFATATEYPRNFGVGRPAMQSQARDYVAAAREYEAAGQRDEAERWWQRAATEELNPPTQPEEPWSEHYFYKAVALEHTGRHTQARALYERLARLNDEQQMLDAEPWPPTGAIRFVLAGAALKALGRSTEARVALERALQMDPQNELARSQLAELKERVGTRTSPPQ
jgi:tetratricopeptide (TPR) repeat protein